MTDEWQKEVSDRMKRLKKLSCRRTRKRQRPEKKEGEHLAKEVEKLLKPIEEDKSKGVHNFIYAQKLLEEAEKKIFGDRTIPCGRIEGSHGKDVRPFERREGGQRWRKRC